MTSADYIQVKKKHRMCIDDSNSKYYNHIVNSKQISDKDWRSAEKMLEILFYEYCMEVL